MSNVSRYSIGLAHELCNTAAKAGFTAEEFYGLSQRPDVMRQMREVFLGRASICIPHIIDCDVAPGAPNDDRFTAQYWSLDEHRKGGQLHWDAHGVALFTSDLQKGVCYGIELRTALRGVPVLNANVLDYLLDNPELIPEDWKNFSEVFFWGTVYSSGNGALCVRSLRWDGVSWTGRYSWLSDIWREDHPAAVRA